MNTPEGEIIISQTLKGLVYDTTDGNGQTVKAIDYVEEFIAIPGAVFVRAGDNGAVLEGPFVSRREKTYH